MINCHDYSENNNMGTLNMKFWITKDTVLQSQGVAFKWEILVRHKRLYYCHYIPVHISVNKRKLVYHLNAVLEYYNVYFLLHVYRNRNACNEKNVSDCDTLQYSNGKLQQQFFLYLYVNHIVIQDTALVDRNPLFAKHFTKFQLLKFVWNISVVIGVSFVFIINNKIRFMIIIINQSRKLSLLLWQHCIPDS